MEGVAKRTSVLLPAPLGQAQSTMQRDCHVATASSSCAKARDIYNKMNCKESERSPCSGACLQSILLG
jgi:hypothetical protein